MKVELIAWTPDPERVVASAVKACHGKALKGPDEISDADIPRLIDMVRTSGHLSVMEHATFTFAVSGVSRVLTHQLVRHRIASYSQQSQRYVDLRGGGYAVPESVSKGDAGAVYRTQIESAMAAYNLLLEMGVPREDARYVLPNAMKSNIVITMNARALDNFLSLRTCRRAQSEIQELAVEMMRLAKEKAPHIFSVAGPPCVRGPCPEGEHTCGKPFPRARK